MVRGTVRSWDEDGGWGVLVSPEVPGELFAHFSRIEGAGFRSLHAGDRVELDWEACPTPGQDGYLFRTTRVVPPAE